jgi:hypothetical protein
MGKVPNHKAKRSNNKKSASRMAKQARFLNRHIDQALACPPAAAPRRRHLPL